MFDEFQTTHPPQERRPKINLYDVFVTAIRDDELEHVKTMIACQQPTLNKPSRVHTTLQQTYY